MTPEEEYFAKIAFNAFQNDPSYHLSDSPCTMDWVTAAMAVRNAPAFSGDVDILIKENRWLNGHVEALQKALADYAQLEKAAQQLVDSKAALQTALSNLGAGTK